MLDALLPYFMVYTIMGTISAVIYSTFTDDDILYAPIIVIFWPVVFLLIGLFLFCIYVLQPWFKYLVLRPIKSYYGVVRVSDVIREVETEEE